MLILLALPVIAGVAATWQFLRCYAPSNMLVRRALVAPPTFRSAVALLALAAGMLAVMHALAEAVATGALGWLNLVVLVLAWDAIKLLLAGLLVLAHRVVVVLQNGTQRMRRRSAPCT